MSEQLNWIILPSNATSSRVFPSANAQYDLVNEYVVQRIVNGDREYGIGLVWDDPDPARPAIRFERYQGGTGAIQYGERVAIHVDGGGWLKYGERKYGINLRWSDRPVFEWRLRGDNPSANALVDATQPVGIFNIVRNDYIFYEERRYGINLKWLSDKGKHNSKPWYESVSDAFTGFFSELGNLIFEVINRGFGIIDFLLTLLGIMLPKRVRIRFIVLRDTAGRAIIADDRLPPTDQAMEQALLDDAIQVVRDCFRTQLNTRVLAANDVLVETLRFPAPAAALSVSCGAGAWGEDFGSEGAYFRAHQVVNNSPYVLGYGAPITVFIVEDVDGKVGCSLGPLTDYVVVDRDGLDRSPGASEWRPTTPMHEIGHSCGLRHRSRRIGPARNTTNLMLASTPRGIELSRVQRALVRNSRHVTFL